MVATLTTADEVLSGVLVDQDDDGVTLDVGGTVLRFPEVEIVELHLAGVA